MALADVRQGQATELSFTNLEITETTPAADINKTYAIHTFQASIELP